MRSDICDRIPIDQGERGERGERGEALCPSLDVKTPGDGHNVGFVPAWRSVSRGRVRHRVTDSAGRCPRAQCGLRTSPPLIEDDGRGLKAGICCG